MLKKIFLLLLFSTTIFAQQKQVTTTIDTTKNKIGAEFKLTLKTNVDTLSKVVFPNLKNFGPLEVIQSYPIDTIKKKDRYELIKKYGLTQFDSGRYTIPSVKILINKKEFLSDSIKVEVANVVVDTLKQKMYDIKDIAPSNESSNWWKYLLFFLLIAGIGAFIYWYIKKYQKAKIEEEIYKTPIERATSLLNTLEKKELWQHGEVKAYYSELTDIVRNYIEEAIEIPAMESTTSELIESLKLASKKKKMKLSQETIDSLFVVLKQADLVKFAKVKPLDFEITDDRKKIERAIVTLDKAIPVVVENNEEEMLLNEMQRQEQLKRELKKQRTKRIVITVASVFILLFITMTYFIVTRGFDYVKDNIIGHPSKELLEGEWVKSAYGNPTVKIETPQVLKRVDLTKTLPKEGMALIKEMQSFAYGSLVGKFYIMVSTLHFKQDTQIDLEKSLDGALQSMEAQGGQNMIVKKEDFETKAGIKGIKGYGTFSQIDRNSQSSTKLYYEVLIFSQEGGLQQIIIVHEEGDAYANQISDRILSSVELQNTKQ